MLRNSNVKKQFGGYPGTHWFLGIKIYLQELFGWCNYRNYYFVSIYLLVGLGRTERKSKFEIQSESQKSKCAVVSGIQKTKNSISSRMNSKLNLPIIILPMRVICSISSQESELSIQNAFVKFRCYTYLYYLP